MADLDAVEQLFATAKPDVSQNKYGHLVTPELLDAVKTVESSGNPLAINKTSGAMGAYQFMPGTVAQLHKQGIKFNPFDEEESRKAAEHLLNKNLEATGGDLNKALGMYGGFVTKDPTEYINKIKSNIKPVEQVEQHKDATDDVEALFLGKPALVKKEQPVVEQKTVSEWDKTEPVQTTEKPLPNVYKYGMQNLTPEELKKGEEKISEKFGSLIGNVEAIIGTIPGLAKSGATAAMYLGEEAMPGVFPPEKREEIANAIADSFPISIAEKLGVDKNSPDYQNALLQRLGRVIGSGVDYAADALGVPRNDVEALANLLPIALTGAPKGKAATALQDQFAALKAGEEFGAKPQLTEAFGERTQRFAEKPERGTTGMGAASVEPDLVRQSRANELDIPIDLSKDQATRNPADVRFARETAKDPVLGQPLQEHYASQNAKIQQNLDLAIEKTGAEMTGVDPGAMGEHFHNVVAESKATRKRAVDQAYNQAREAGELNEPINVSRVTDYVDGLKAESINAPVIKSVQQKLSDLIGEDKTISLNDLEQVRQMVNNLAEPGTPNAVYGRRINRLIDDLTKDAGGELYKTARKEYANYINEFENTPVLRQITSLKKGTNERTVAFENLVDKSLSGSRQSVERLFNSLENMGEAGQQMVRELRGTLAEKIKNEATKGVQRDINGMPYVSTAGLDKTITALDKSGKLDFIFGREQAAKYRTLNDVTKDIQTVPQGTTNPSGTASTILASLAEMGAQTALSGVPIPAAMIAKHLYGKRQTAKKLNKINEFLNYGKTLKE